MKAHTAFASTLCALLLVPLTAVGQIHQDGDVLYKRTDGLNVGGDDFTGALPENTDNALPFGVLDDPGSSIITQINVDSEGGAPTHGINLLGDNFDLAFTFQMYDSDGQFSFTENFDDRVEITITPIVSATDLTTTGASVVHSDVAWDVRTYADYNFASGGWFDAQVLMSEDGGGAQSAGGIGFGYSNATSSFNEFDYSLIGGGAVFDTDGNGESYGSLIISFDPSIDTDGDGIPDGLEEQYFPGDLTKLGTGDFDGDGLNDPQEIADGTDPTNSDTDGDGLGDGVENTNGTDPTNPDTDGDGLTDGAEATLGTDPLVVDTDGDGSDDGVEVALGTDPNDDQDFPEMVAIVDVDATTLGLADGVSITTIANLGTAGLFTTVTGNVTAFSHPANNVPGILIQGLGFNNGAARMNSAVTAESVGLSGNASYSITSWVWNPAIVNEEAIVAWGNRGGPDGTNAGFHQGTHAGFGAIGHWGAAADTGWGNGGTDINATIGQWSHLSVTFDGNEHRLFIDGVLSNSKNIGAINVHGGTNVISIGSESDNGSTTATPIPYSGTIAQVQVWDIVMSDQDILDDFNADKLLFFDGVSNVLDSDGDGIVDEIEDLHLCLDKNVADADADPDSDGLSSAEELLLGTDPCDADSDGDGVSDGDEVNRMVGGQAAPTNPLNADTDGDGLTDDVETDTGVNNGPSDTGTDPLSADTDGDIWPDGVELAMGTDPNDDGSHPRPQLFHAGNVLIDVNVGGLEVGSSPTTLPNTGTVVGDFTLVNKTGAPNPEVVELTDGSLVTQRGIYLNREEHFQNVFKGPVSPDNLTAPGASRSIEVWGFNQAQEHGEEMMVGWGRRGGPDGSNMAFGWTNQGSFGAVGHWGGGPDIPWGPAGAETPPLNEWRHLVYTYDGTDTRLYDNGVLVHTEFSGLHDTHDGFSFIIGGQNAANAPHDPTVDGVGAGSFGGNFRGVISRVRIHDGVLSDAEVQSNFSAGPDAPPPPDHLNLNVELVGNDLEISWDSQPGKLYNLRSSLDLQPDPDAWPIYLTHENIVATPPRNSLTIPRPPDTVRFFVIEEFPAPPVVLYDEDFEPGVGEWTTGVDGDPGSDWELGTPNSIFEPASGAHSGVNCFGTIIGGTYSVSANVWLLSPEIDLTTAAVATLSYFEFRDIDDFGDSGSITIFDAADDSLIAVLEADVTGLNNDWAEVTFEMPAAALGKTIQVEFRFTSDPASLPLFGWYIDDVLVTEP